jgi:antitoxin VapB
MTVDGAGRVELAYVQAYVLGTPFLALPFGICFEDGPFAEMADRRVKLFRNGRNQAVRIPREFELPGNDATIRREGRRLIIEPAPPKSLLAVLASLPTLREDFPPTEDRPAEPTPSLPSPAGGGG